MQSNSINLPADFPELNPGDEMTSQVIPHSDILNDSSFGRQLALQALYELDSSTHKIGDVINSHLANQGQAVPNKASNFMRRLVRGVTENRVAIDTLIQSYAQEFPLQQVAVIDRNILRIAVFEFAISSKTPTGVAIDEAIELAKVFGSDNSTRFINGVLGSIADNYTGNEADLPEITDQETAQEDEAEE